MKNALLGLALLLFTGCAHTPGSSAIPIVSTPTTQSTAIPQAVSNTGARTLGGSVQQLTTATDFYVDANSGNDANPGTVAQPWKTISHGWTTIASNYVINNVLVRLLLQPGTYDGTLLINPIGSFNVGPGPIVNYTPTGSWSVPMIMGNPANPASAVIVNGGFSAVNDSGVSIFLGHMTLNSPTGQCVVADWGSSLYLGDLTFGNCFQAINAEFSSRIEVINTYDETILSGGEEFVLITTGSTFTFQGGNHLIFIGNPKYTNAVMAAQNNSFADARQLTGVTGSFRGNPTQNDASSQVPGAANL